METATDPKAIVDAFDALWNSGNREAILAGVTDSSVVEIEPAPPPPVQSHYIGREQIAQFLGMFLPGFHVESRNFRQEGDEIVWEFTARADAFRALGADPASGTGRLQLGPDRQLRRFKVQFDEATLAQMQGQPKP